MCASPRAGALGERQLASRLCHIGQPVSIPGPGGETAALRISAGARIATENWTDAGAGAAIHNLRREFEQVRAILDQVDLLLRNLPALEGGMANPGAVALPAIAGC